MLPLLPRQRHAFMPLLTSYFAIRRLLPLHCWLVRLEAPPLRHALIADIAAGCCDDY